MLFLVKVYVINIQQKKIIKLDYEIFSSRKSSVFQIFDICICVHTCNRNKLICVELKKRAVIGLQLVRYCIQIT